MVTYFPFPFALSSVNFPGNAWGEVGIILKSLRSTWIFMSQWSLAIKLIITIQEGHRNLELAIELNFFSKEPKPFKPSQVFSNRKSFPWVSSDRNGQALVRSQWASYRPSSMGKTPHHHYSKTVLIWSYGGLAAFYSPFTTAPPSYLFLFLSLFRREHQWWTVTCHLIFSTLVCQTQMLRPVLLVSYPFPSLQFGLSPTPKL